MAQPTQQKMAKFVLDALDIWRTRSIDAFEYAQELGLHLGIEGIGLRTLSGNLRSYVQLNNEEETLTLRELKKAKNVGPTIALVINKIAGSEPTQARIATLIEDWGS